MKTLLIIAILGIAAYFYYPHFRAPVATAAPSYAEVRVDVEVASRTINMVLFAKMLDEGDCRQRTEAIWRKILQDCKDCAFQVMNCKSELSLRYAQLFDDEPINLTYLSMKQGSGAERDGRLVIWGLTVNEAAQVCDQMKGAFRSRYTGDLRCIAGRDA